MLHNIDRHAPTSERKLKVGDRVRLPVDDLLRPQHGVYRHTFEVVAFGANKTSVCGQPGRQWLQTSSNAHLVQVRRLADGWAAWISSHYVVHYRDELGEWWLDESIGHDNVNRLALMRGDLEQALWSLSVELRYFQEAQWREREARLESWRRDGCPVLLTTGEKPRRKRAA